MSNTTPHTPRVSLQHLQQLQTLVEERSVTRAAERMGLGQPAMSAALAKLRAAFKDELLVQTRAGMEPTPRALEVTRLSRQLIALSQGRGVMSETFMPGESTAHWKLMASDAIARRILPRLMAYTGQHASKMSFTVFPGDPRLLRDKLREGEFDLAITFARKPAGELRQVSLPPQQLVCIARQNHPAFQGKITLKQFTSQSHVRWGAPPVMYATLEAMVDEKLARRGHEREVSLMLSELDLIPEVVAGSNLLAVVPQQVARRALKTLPIQILPMPLKVPPVELSLIWHERLHQDPAHQWLRRTLLNQFDKTYV
jgi:DNA-binding transcriptional LysR family regulator